MWDVLFFFFFLEMGAIISGGKSELGPTCVRKEWGILILPSGLNVTILRRFFCFVVVLFVGIKECY